MKKFLVKFSILLGIFVHTPAFADIGTLVALPGSPTLIGLPRVSASLDGQNIYVVQDSGGGTYFSNNAGTTFTAASSLGSTNYQGVAAFNGGAVVVGTSATPYKTTDNGSSWTALGASAGTTSYDVWASQDGQTIVILDTSGNIKKSTDGGANFSTIATGITGRFLTMSLDGTKGMVCSNAGLSQPYTTTDGNTWTLVGTANYYKSCATASNGTYAVITIGVTPGPPEAGKIYRTTDFTNFTNVGVGFTSIEYKGGAYGDNVLLPNDSGQPAKSIDGGLNFSFFDTSRGWRTAWVGTDRAYAATYAGLVYGTDTANPNPPPEPISEFINGLTCTTDFIPTLSGATAFSFGNLPNVYNADDPSVPDLGWVMFGTGGGDSGDRDVIFYSPAGTGSVLGTGSFIYPGTSTGVLYYPDNDRIGNLGLQTLRNAIPQPYNIFQLYGTSNIAGNYAGTFNVELTNGQAYSNIPLSSSGGIVTGTVANTNAYISVLGIQYLTRFKGLRLLYGTPEAKKSCSINFNICEWSYEGANLECISRQTASGVDFAGCGVTGSGSVYGSGACVPLADGSGAIIPPPAVTGGFVTIDDQGNVVGTVAPPPTGQNTFYNVFSCGIDYAADDWWVTIGKVLYCPVQVVFNLTKKMWDGMVGTQARLDQLGTASTKIYSGATADTSTGSSYTGSNTAVAKLFDINEEISESKWVVIAKYAFYVLGCIILIGTIIGITKS